MAALPYMQFYVADYLADTMHLTTEEHGAYLLLIMNYWQTGKPIPKNRLQKITRLPNDRWNSVAVSLQEFFNENASGEWVHARIEADLKAARDSQKQRERAGKASAEARKRAKMEKDKESAKAGSQGPASARTNENPTPVKRPLERGGNENPTNKEQNRTEQNRIESQNTSSKGADGLGLEQPEQTAAETPEALTKKTACDEQVEQANRVIAILNHTAGKKYRLTDTNRKPIIARLKDGFTERDCQHVIANRVMRWQGTEHAQYLRPHTLFRLSKFESYLNDAGEVGTKNSGGAYDPQHTDQLLREMFPDDYPDEQQGTTHPMGETKWIQ